MKFVLLCQLERLILMKKNKFIKAFSENKKHFSPTGSRIATKFGWTSKGGILEWINKGDTNLYEFIQSHRESVELSHILQRYKDGDATVLQKVEGMYIDSTLLPKTPGELYEKVEASTEVFNNLPVEVKNEFGNNPYTFWSSSIDSINDSFDRYNNHILAQRNLVDNGTLPIDNNAGGDN